MICRRCFKTHRFFFRFCTFLLAALAFHACKKDRLTTSADARLSTSTDTLRYDTVFTTVGSVTQTMKLYNFNEASLRIDEIGLSGGSASPYTLNINGLAGPVARDITLAAGDSLYLFVTVRINPVQGNLPFLVRDSIRLAWNGNNRFVQLQAYGQNAHFLRNETIRGTRNFINDLPYVIIDRLTVDTTAQLNIGPGCRIYAENNAPVLVYGTLRALGTKAEPVLFTGSRLDAEYRDLPASWPGIIFRETSKDNVLKFATVKNAYQALVSVAPSSNQQPKVILQQCTIDNAYDAGIYSINSQVNANNCLISNCGNNINILLGGTYRFENCTVAAYSVFFSHKKPVLSATNAAVVNGSPLTAPLDARFVNCIFWAENSIVKNEVQAQKEGSEPYNFLLSHCLYKSETDPANVTLDQCIANADPLFDSTDTRRNFFNFRTSSADAPGLGRGTPTSFLKDLDDNLRNSAAPDLGCYQRQ
jgi:hypothetical protein